MATLERVFLDVGPIMYRIS